MQVTFLGTSAGMPTRSRNTSAVALYLRPPRGAARLWLFDCGEGTQIQLMRSPLKIGQLEKIFITHLHGDHFFGLIGLLATRALQNSETPLTVYGPPGLAAYILKIN